MTCFICIITDVHFHITQHVAILTAAEDGAVDDATSDIDFHFIDISPSVEESARVTLTRSKEVASNRMILDLFQCSRDTKGCRSTKVDRTLTS